MKIFRKEGLLYIPTKLMGMLLVITLLVLTIETFIIVDSRSHSVSDTLLGSVPYFILYLAIYYWIASHNSEKLIRTRLKKR